MAVTYYIHPDGKRTSTEPPAQIDGIDVKVAEASHPPDTPSAVDAMFLQQVVNTIGKHNAQVSSGSIAGPYMALKITLSDV